jgi:hypothetical protein
MTDTDTHINALLNTFGPSLAQTRASELDRRALNLNNAQFEHHALYK